MAGRSALIDVFAEYRLEVDDRRPIQRLETAHPHSPAVDGGDLHPVQADGIGTVRRTGTEDSLLRPGRVPPRVHAQDVATSAIQPGKEDDLIPGPEAPE